MQAPRLTIHPGWSADLVRRGPGQRSLLGHCIEDKEMNSTTKTTTLRLPFGALLYLARKAGFLPPKQVPTCKKQRTTKPSLVGIDYLPERRRNREMGG